MGQNYSQNAPRTQIQARGAMMETLMQTDGKAQIRLYWRLTMTALMTFASLKTKNSAIVSRI